MSNPKAARIALFSLRCRLGRHDWGEWRDYSGGQIRWCNRCKVWTRRAVL